MIIFRIEFKVKNQYVKDRRGAALAGLPGEKIIRAHRKTQRQHDDRVRYDLERLAVMPDRVLRQIPDDQQRQGKCDGSEPPNRLRAGSVRLSR